MKNDFIHLTKIRIEELDKEFYLAKDIAKHWGHTNMVQAINRSLNKSEYIVIDRNNYGNVFNDLLNNNVFSKKVQRIILVTEEGALSLAMRSSTKKSKEFVNSIVSEIVKARKEFGISEVDFIGILSNSYQQTLYGAKTYIMIDEKSGLYKIGMSKNPRERETTLAGQMPCIKLLLIADSNIERTLHKLFEDKRKRGEWFALSADDIITLVTDYGFKKADKQDLSPF